LRLYIICLIFKNYYIKIIYMYLNIVRNGIYTDINMFLDSFTYDERYQINATIMIYYRK